jgi:hypothetical protein
MTCHIANSRAVLPLGPDLLAALHSVLANLASHRVIFSVIPVVVMLVHLIGFAPRIYRWLYVRRIDRLQRALGNLERQLAHRTEKPRIDDVQAHLPENEFPAQSLKVRRPCSKSICFD